MRAAAITPAGSAGASIAHYPADASLPRPPGGSAPASDPFEACSAFTRVAARMVAKSPKATRYIEVLQAMSLPPSPAPTATGWSDSCRAGFAPAVGQRRQGAQVNGNRRTSPMMPPRPGMAPSQIPMKTPRNRKPIDGHSNTWVSPSKNASSMLRSAPRKPRPQHAGAGQTGTLRRRENPSSSRYQSACDDPHPEIVRWQTHRSRNTEEIGS